MKKKSLLELFIRYAILLLVAIPNFYLFYLIFTPLTVYGVFLLLKIFFDTALLGNILLIGEIPIKIIGACVAGAAYYLLLVLNLSTPGMKTNKRIKLVFQSFLLLYLFNVLRIFFLSLLIINNSTFFDITHQIFWYLISTFFVVGIWFYQVKRNRIKEIPFYSDFYSLYKKSLFRKKR
jgi:exosortase/archaeosortase family protein